MKFWIPVLLYITVCIFVPEYRAGEYTSGFLSCSEAPREPKEALDLVLVLLVVVPSMLVKIPR